MKGSREREDEAATMRRGERQLKKVPRSSILPMRGWTGSLRGGMQGCETFEGCEAFEGGGKVEGDVNIERNEVKGTRISTQGNATK